MLNFLLNFVNQRILNKNVKEKKKLAAQLFSILIMARNISCLEQQIITLE